MHCCRPQDRCNSLRFDRVYIDGEVAFGRPATPDGEQAVGCVGGHERVAVHQVVLGEFEEQALWRAPVDDVNLSRAAKHDAKFVSRLDVLGSVAGRLVQRWQRVEDSDCVTGQLWLGEQLVGGVVITD